jgi:sarcosine oxidase
VAAVDTEIVVVGAGVMGLATAQALNRAGRDVVVLEQFELGHDRGSSHGSSRIVRLSYPEARWVRLAQESFPLWRELEAETGRTLLELHGTLDLGDWGPNRDALTECEVPFEVLDAGQIEHRFGILADPGDRGLFQADGGIILADAALEALAAGLEIRERCPVDAVEENRDGVSAGGLRARAAVVTVGAWAPSLVGVDATPTAETASYFDLGRSVPSVIDTTTGPHHAYALASPGGALKAGLHQSGRPVEPDAPSVPDRELSARTAAWVARRFRHVGAVSYTETCLYTIREHDEFLLERRGRIVVGSACSGHGFKFAPVVGMRLGALALEALAAEQPR